MVFVIHLQDYKIFYNGIILDNDEITLLLGEKKKVLPLNMRAQ